jgi:hypothetical protein
MDLLYTKLSNGRPTTLCAGSLYSCSKEILAWEPAADEQRRPFWVPANDIFMILSIKPFNLYIDRAKILYKDQVLWFNITIYIKFLKNEDLCCQT